MPTILVRKVIVLLPFKVLPLQEMSLCLTTFPLTQKLTVTCLICPYIVIKRSHGSPAVQQATHEAADNNEQTLVNHYLVIMSEFSYLLHH